MASAVAVVIALLGVIWARGARLLYAAGLTFGVGLGIGTLASIPALIPCLGY